MGGPPQLDFSPPSRTAPAFTSQGSAKVAAKVSEVAPAVPVVPALPAMSALPGVKHRVLPDPAEPLRERTLSDLARGDFVDRFDNDELLGKGSFGSVHRCRDKRTGKFVAVKVLNDKEDLGCSCATGPDGERYRMVLRSLKCPHILEYHGVFDGSSACFVVMELLEGSDFFDFMVGLKRFTEADVAGWIRQILIGIAYINSRGLTHRDVKPENVMWSKKGNSGALKLVDFGLATLDLAPRALRRRDAVGTLLYCAPEVLAGSANMCCDVWAVGVIVYTLFAGDLPYDVSPRVGEEGVLHPAQDRGLLMPSPLWDKVSVTAKHFVRELLHVDPLLRPSSSEALDLLWAASTAVAVEVTVQRQTRLSKSMASSRASAQYVGHTNQQRAIEERRAAEERQAAAQKMWAWQNQCF